VESKRIVLTGLGATMVELFPTICGKNLNKQKKSIPDDYIDKNLVVITAFQRWHQELVDNMISNLEQLNVNDTHYIIEVPVVSQLSLLRRMRLDAIMRVGIRDYTIRERTVTVYTDKEEFKQKLGIKNEEEIHWFIVNTPTKSILARGSGVMSIDEITQFIS
jgi:hypothetical protein